MTEFDSLLKSLGACGEARTWAKGKDFAEVWTTCERGDWLLWLCGSMIGKEGWPTHQQIVLAACDCAELALVHVKKGEERPRIAIETARKWAHGEADIEQVRQARHAAAAAADAAAAAYAAAAAAAAAAYAAYAAAADAADAARTKTLKTCADLVRKSIPMPLFDKVTK